MSFRIMQALHQGGGAGSVTSTLHLSIGLAKLGHHVLFVCPPDSEAEAAARQGGLDVRPLFLPPHARRKNAVALLALLERDRPQLINSQSARDRQALTWLGLTGRLRVPAVFTRRQMPLTFWLENWLASRAATRVIAVSQAVADALARKGTPRSKLVVIHNGLVTERIDRPVNPVDLERWRKRIGWRPDQLTAGIVARRKDQAVVLRSLDQVEVPLHLVMAGVEDSGELAQAARQVPGRHRVTLVPFDSEVRPLYDLVDLVLLPSRMEGLSQALLEAMALGKPVAVSAATGNLEVVTDGVDGLLVSPLDPSAWARAITRLVSDRPVAARLGDAARTTAREKFSLARTVESTERLYGQLIADR
jgi:L-malate glycosyltransferase